MSGDDLHVHWRRIRNRLHKHPWMTIAQLAVSIGISREHVKDVLDAYGGWWKSRAGTNGGHTEFHLL